MEDEEVVQTDLTEQARQQRIQYAAGTLGRKEIGGLKCYETDPDDRWPPGAQKVGTRRSQSFSSLLRRVIRGFARDHDVVHVAFAQTGGADAHEARLLLQFSHRLAPAISHARPQPAHHLVHDHRYRTTIRHAPFNSFRHQLTKA